jgi:hypothetical protein
MGLKQLSWEVMDWIDLARGWVVCFCEGGTEPLGSIKCGAFLD